MSGSNLLHRVCPVCAAPESAPVLRKQDLQLVRCVGCGMVFADPVPREFETGDFYDHSGSYYLSDAKLAGDYAPVRFERELRIFRKYCASGRVLDVGCSTGAFLYQLKTRFQDAYEVLGTDVAGPALDYAASKSISVLRGNFLEQRFAERFDAVTFWAVVEHLVHPAPFLEKAAAILKPGGFCFVLVPNFRSLATRMLGARYRYILPQHVNYFTPESLAALGRRNFELVEMKTTHFNPLVIVKDFRAQGAEPSEEKRAELLKKTTALKQNSWLAPVRAAYKLSEGMLSALNLADNVVAVLRRAK